MSSPAVPWVSPEEYLERERTASWKSEYVCGEIVAMAGGSVPHSLIINNAQFVLTLRLQDKPGFVFNSDLRVSVRWRELITYPDVTVLCSPPEYVDDKRDVIKNPTMIIEVLSPSTKAFDRGEKSKLYRSLASLQEYLLIEPEPVDIEHWRRLSGGTWEVTAVREPDAILRLSSVGCEVAVAEIYRKVELL